MPLNHDWLLIAAQALVCKTPKSTYLKPMIFSVDKMLLNFLIWTETANGWFQFDNVCDRL